MNPLTKALHERAKKIAQNYHQIESDLIEILQKLDQKKVFRDLGYSSLFKYCLDELNLSEATAYNFITVSRKATEIPELKEEIIAGHITVTKARKITPVLKKANADLWLQKARTLPQRQLEQAVAKEVPQVLTPEKSTYVTEKRLRLQIGVDESLYNQLKRVQDLLSQKNQKPASLEDALGAMVQVYIEKHDPIKKAQRAMKRKDEKLVEKRELKTKSYAKNLSSRQVLEKSHSKRRAVPAGVLHTIKLRDQGQCTYRQNGKRCQEKRWLDVHHIHPVSLGGKNDPGNLVTLCKMHHRLLHQDGEQKVCAAKYQNTLFLAPSKSSRFL